MTPATLPGAATHPPSTTPPQPPQLQPRPALWLRMALLISVALALASSLAAGTTDAPYEDRLVDMALRQTYAGQWDSVAAQPMALKALLLDYDQELAFKAQWGLAKYGDDAQDLLLRFGDDPTFQQVLRQYGENALPVIAYFVKNDITSLRLTYLAQQKSDSAIATAKSLWDRFWSSKPGQTAKTPDTNANDSTHAKPTASDSDSDSDSYGPDLRGQRAMGFILDEGHLFLGQFVINAQGQAAWVQTERSVAAAKSFFLSGVIGLEKKYQSGQPLAAVDVLSAGLDVFIVAGTFKALKFLRATQQVRAVGVLKRSQLLAAPLLGRSALGRYAMKYGVLAGTAYLVVQHPSLLSGIFVTVGQWLGVSPLLAKTLGWSALLLPLLWPLLALLGGALSTAGGLLLATGKGLRWALRRLGFSRAAA